MCLTKWNLNSILWNLQRNLVLIQEAADTHVGVSVVRYTLKMKTGYFSHSGILVKLFILLVCSTWGLGNETPTTNSYLTESDRLRLKQVFNSAWALKDLPSVHYAVLGHKLLSEPVPNPKDICKFLVDSIGAAPTPEIYFFVTVAWKTVGNCPGTLPSKEIIENLNGVLEKEGTSIPDIYYAVKALKSVGHSISQPPKIIKALQAALKKDDSISNLGYTMHIASELGPAGVFAMDRVEDAVVQADEVNGKYLQFEGGLTITALVVTGAYKLATAVDKAPAITDDQAVRFTNYFLSRHSVQTTKGAHSLLTALTTMADNKFQTGVVVVGLDGRVVGPSGELRVRLVDPLGRPLPQPLTLSLESATRAQDSVVAFSKLKFNQSPADKTVYSVSLKEAIAGGAEAGAYKGVVSAGGGGGKKLVGGVGVPLPFTVPAVPLPEPLQIGVADTDQTTTPKLHTVKYPGKLGGVLELDSQQKLLVRFTLKDKRSGKPLAAHQTFLRLVHASTNQEVIFVAELDANNNYKLDLDIGGKAGELGWTSGTYRIELIVGDVILSPSFAWTLAELKLKLASEPQQKTPPLKLLYAPRPEIMHLFREPEKRPPVFVSNLFTGLVLVPLLVLFGLWIKLGVNISNFPFSLTAIGFHLGLAGIFGLFALFWLQLNMFETLKYLMGLGVVTFLCGNQMLAKIAANRKN